MIQALSNQFRQVIALCFSLAFYVQLILPLHSLAAGTEIYAANSNIKYARPGKIKMHVGFPDRNSPTIPTLSKIKDDISVNKEKYRPLPNSSNYIGGPSSPETNSFKAVGSDNLVNLFTGDFSYSIPLLDVGGYPVNLFYNGGITMEQEASWVGLGWNINPGSVSRNMRGVPDDFDGTDILAQTQNVKPNKTWGGELSIDGEIIGIKQPNLNLSLGYSYNNYLGPELDMGAGLSVSIPLTKTAVHEKTAPLDSSQGLTLNPSLGLGAKLSSRSGLTLSPSLNVGLHSASQKMDLGIGLSTSYNSRTGIKDLNIHSQMDTYRYQNSKKGEPNPDNQVSLNASLASSTISFARPSYMPTLRMPMQYGNYSGQLEIGLGMFGLRGSGTMQGYYSVSKVADGSMVISKPMVGYMYLENANGRKDAVMDFNRLNDGEVTPNTPILSAPQYDYDIFSIQGEGTGGSIRAYRGDIGFMKDHETTSKDNNISIGFDIAPPGHYGGNWNIVSTPTRSGGWDDANNTLNQTLLFKGPSGSGSFENIYFRNPGETTVTNDNLINKIGQDNLVRFKLNGSAVTPRLQSQLEQFSKSTGAPLGTISLANANASQQRDKRTQVITMLNATDASHIGLDGSIKNYQPTLDAGQNLQFNSIPRVGGYRKGNHISEVDVLEGSGMRYVYGLPVYSVTQKDFTFSVGNVGDPATNLVGYDPANEPTTASTNITGNTGIDGYVNIQQTPAYASSFLITGLLSPDYVDVTGDGITEDDLGSAVKFNYTMSASTHKWRTPRNNTTAATAHFNVGLKSEKRDNKATISYGEREAWYMHSIESKSMIAIFKTSARSDAKGVVSDLDGRINTAENANLKLDSILLYTKADLKANGLIGAIPLKTVHFEYSYSLCSGTQDNAAGGKLTLTDIYFTFNGQVRASKNMYVFNYGNLSSNLDNPQYAYNASDRWGTYKPVKDSTGANVNPNGLSNIDYPYTITDKSKDDQYAGVWSLKKILLPSGGQMEVQYETDDYAYVQNRRACNMFNIYGLGTSTNYTQSNMLYTINGSDQNYVYIQLPAALQNTDPIKQKQEIYNKYLEGINQFAFKLNINMPKGMEPLTVYANRGDYGLCANSTGSNPIIYIQLMPLTANGPGPLANASVHFLIDNLPGQAFPGYDMSENTQITDFFYLVIDALGSLKNAFRNAESQVRSAGFGSSISLANSFIRLNDPDYAKYGGGHRVKRVLVKDNWNAMSGQYNSQYGQDYDYTTTTMVNGVATTISSGVASYEPGIGSEENPFREILQFQDKLPLASAQYGAIEMPMLEGLYPSPTVGYSKVAVRSINRNGTQGSSIVKSSIGKQVTQFYTAKDYPTISTYTPMSNMDYHSSTPFSFLYKETIDRRTTSQGFLVQTNDMHGKMRSQSAYSESDGNTPLSYTYHSYKNTGANGLNDKVDFVHNDQNGAVISGNMGVDMELMTDVREFNITSKGFNGQIQTDFFTFVPWPVFGIFMLPLQSYTENKYRSVTTTKLINYHAIEDSVIVNDKGSTVSTKTIAYDAETGSPIVTKTANEFNDPVYNVTYPAYWAYSGVAPAYKNIGMQFSGVNFSDGKIVSGVTDQSVFESGDELYVTAGSGSPSCLDASAGVTKIWAFDVNKNTTALTVPSANRTLVFMDADGNLFTQAGVSCRIVRSGKRNNLGLTISSVTAMQNPIQTFGGNRKLIINNADNIVTASAVAFKEKWQVDNGIMPKTSFTLVNCVYVESPDCNGTLIKHINPYVKGLVGNFKPYRSYTYYGTRNETDPTVNTTIRKNGYISGFNNYWGFDANSNLVPDDANTNWVWNSELTKTNAHGQELETRDALNRYTAVQYGFNKNLPVAMVQNARNGQAFNEGFEDYGFNDAINDPLNNAVLNSCDSSRYISFNGLSNATLINTDTSLFKAHTGKFDLLVKPNALVTKPLLLKPSVVDSFNFNWKADNSGVLNDPGGNISLVNVTPQFAGIANDQTTNLAYLTQRAAFANGGYNSGTISSGNTKTNKGTYLQWTHSFSFNVSYYLQVQQSNNYTFLISASNNGNDAVTQDESDMTFYIYDINGNVVDFRYINSATASSISFSRNLCKGIYFIKVTISDNFNTTTNLNATQISSTNNYSISLSTNSSLSNYKTLSITPTCTFTDPIPATDSMQNPTFALVPGNKTQLSAWVREDCGNATGTPCYTTSYLNDHIVLLFPGSTTTPSLTFKPTGTIIDGWQKIESAFTVPADATSASLVLSNDGARNVYFDDIRIHPFNADMKGYVYDPRTLRLSAELDDNNYATFYDYDEEGQLIRVKKETIAGIKTIKETRSAKQKSIMNVQ